MKDKTKYIKQTFFAEVDNAGNQRMDKSNNLRFSSYLCCSSSGEGNDKNSIK